MYGRLLSPPPQFNAVTETDFWHGHTMLQHNSNAARTIHAIFH